MKCSVGMFCLVLSQSVSADWCSGSHFFIMNMPLSERVEEAGDALLEAMDILTDKARLLKLDMQTEAENTREELSRLYSNLSEQTVALCEQLKEQDFPANFQNTRLVNHAEVSARLKLNLELLQAQKSAYAEANNQLEKMDVLAGQMEEKAAMLSILLRQTESQSSVKTKPASADQFVQSACLAMNRSKVLLQQAHLLDRDALLAESIVQISAQGIDSPQWNNFKGHCQVAPLNDKFVGHRYWLGDMVHKINDWF